MSDLVCLTQAKMEQLLCGAPPLEERIALLEHIAECDVCAEAIAAQTMRLPCVPMPPDLTGQTLARARARKQESLGQYALRVFAAMAAALILLFTGAFGFLTRLPDEVPKLRETIQAQVTEFFDSKKEGISLASKPE